MFKTILILSYLSLIYASITNRFHEWVNEHNIILTDYDHTFNSWYDNDKYIEISAVGKNYIKILKNSFYGQYAQNPIETQTIRRIKITNLLKKIKNVNRRETLFSFMF